MWARLVGLLSPLLGASSVSLSRRGMGGGRSASASLRVTSNGGRHAVAAGGTSRYFVVGDVHGCLDELEALIALAQLDEGTRLVLVGDLVNKGPKSAETVRWCRARDVLAVRGNHEEALPRQWRKLEAGRPVAAKYEYVRDLSTHDVACSSDLSSLGGGRSQASRHWGRGRGGYRPRHCTSPSNIPVGLATRATCSRTTTTTKPRGRGGARRIEG